MSCFNRVCLLGNLCRDPELKHTPAGTPVCDMRLAVSETFAGKDGEKRERVLFIDVTAWGKQASLVSEHFRKGSPMLLEGALVLEEWESNEGEKRSKVSVQMQKLVFLPRNVKEGGGGPAGGGAPEPEEKRDDTNLPF